MMEVHYYVHGRGRGHATRALEVIPALKRAGYQVRVFAGSSARRLLASEVACWPIHSLLPGEPFLTGPKLLQRTLWACTRGLKQAPFAVISDGDLPSSVASRAAGVPVIAIGHGLVFSHCKPAAGTDRGAWGREARKAGRASLGSLRQIPVSFCELELSSPSAVLARHGPPVWLGRRHRRGGIVCYFRDDNGRRALEALRACGVTPRLFSGATMKIPGVVEEAFDRDEFLGAVADADGVVSSAGHQLISECLALGVPHLALHSARDDEQKLNAELLEATRLGDGAAIESVDRARVLHFLGRLPELARLRERTDCYRKLPPLGCVVVDMLEQLRCEANARPGAARIGA